MSFLTIGWAYSSPRARNLTTAQLATLLAIAYHTDAETWRCWPGAKKLADETNQNVKTIREHFRVLEDAGLIRRTRRYREGAETSSWIEVLPGDDPLPPQQVGAVPGEPVGGVPAGRVGGVPVRRVTEPQEEPQEEHDAHRPVGDTLDDVLVEAPPVALDEDRPAPKATPVAVLDAEFAGRFWPAYPRKVSKETARRAYRMARRKTSLDALLAGLAAYQKHKPDWQDYAYAASWLNGGRWEDVYETARPDAPVRTTTIVDADPDDVEAWIAAVEEASRGTR